MNYNLFLQFEMKYKYFKTIKLAHQDRINSKFKHLRCYLTHIYVRIIFNAIVHDLYASL